MAGALLATDQESIQLLKLRVVGSFGISLVTSIKRVYDALKRRFRNVYLCKAPISDNGDKRQPDCAMVPHTAALHSPVQLFDKQVQLPRVFEIRDERSKGFPNRFHQPRGHPVKPWNRLHNRVTPQVSCFAGVAVTSVSTTT